MRKSESRIPATPLCSRTDVKPNAWLGEALGKFWLVRCAGVVILFCMATMLEEQARRPTCEDHLQREGNQRHEIIDGNPLIASAPELRHHARSVI